MRSISLVLALLIAGPAFASNIEPRGLSWKDRPPERIRPRPMPAPPRSVPLPEHAMQEGDASDTDTERLSYVVIEGYEGHLPMPQEILEAYGLEEGQIVPPELAGRLIDLRVKLENPEYEPE